MRRVAPSNTLPTGEVDLHYQSVGKGESVVLIHGLGANLAFWFLSAVRVLAVNYRVITYDLRGHGKSSMPPQGYRLDDMIVDLSSLLDHLQIERCHIVGHSFGARIALLYSIRFPERVRSLTVADTQLSVLQPRLRLREWSYWQEWRTQLLNIGVTPPDDNEVLSFKLLAWLNQHSLDVTLSGVARSSHKRPSLRNRNMGTRGSVLWERLLATTTAERDFEDDHAIQVEGLRGIKAPTLAAYGEVSHCMPTGRKLPALISACDLKVVPRAGHFHPATRPKIFLHILQAFLLQHTSP